jgi:formylglycine-generating enzyme required for sulfatase activity
MANLIIQRQRRQTQYFTEDLGNGIGLDMILIPGGSFEMGSPSDELEHDDTEAPQHEVTVSEFFMGRYPITQAQWRVVAGFSRVNRDLKPNPSYFKGDKRPVERVSWYDAVEFCQRLTQETGRPYRLPTEAEWEFACRAGTNTPFHFGKTITTDLANYRGTDNETYGWSGSYGRGSKGEYREETTPVDHFQIANAYGLCDMHGNVWEWCLDHWHNNYEGAPTDGSAWLSDNENASRVIRGGSWSFNPRDCRSASRYLNDPGLDYDNIGFRVVCAAPRILQ